MPSNYDVFILPATELSLSAKMHSQYCNGKEKPSSPQNTLNNYAEKWQISKTSEAFARKLDENDPLNHVRKEFYYPKVGTLPKGIFIYEGIFSI